MAEVEIVVEDNLNGDDDPPWAYLTTVTRTWSDPDVVTVEPLVRKSEPVSRI